MPDLDLDIEYILQKETSKVLSMLAVYTIIPHQNLHEI